MKRLVWPVCTRRITPAKTVPDYKDNPAQNNAGHPAHIRSDNGAEFTAHVVRDRLGRIGVKTLYIELGSPWGKGYNESFNGKLRSELLNGEIFYSMKEATILIERWRRHYNTVRPYSSLNYKPPAPQATLPTPSELPYAPGSPDEWL